MKVKITKEAKKYITVAEMPYVRQIVEYMKEDDCIEDYVKMAAKVISGDRYSYAFEVLKAEARIVKNCRVWDEFGENTGNFDVCIDFYVYNKFYGFIDGSICLTDVWQISYDGDNDEYIKSHMYYRKFEEVK